MDAVKSIFNDEDIELYGIIDFDKLKIINPRLLPKENHIRSAIIILMPYRRGDIEITDGFNMGLFARIPDYHCVFRSLAEKISPKIENVCGGKVYSYADHSPINEKDAARQCGLGFVGKNSLLINPTYGSFVFIGCFLLTEKLEELIHTCHYDCGSCTVCADACPTGAVRGGVICKDKCLSAISQKRRKTKDERAVLNASKTIWGCDICQNACPYNSDTKKSPIKVFSENLLENVSLKTIQQMDEEAYSKYAFSYRDKRTVEENFLTDND